MRKIENVANNVGNFLYRAARKLEDPAPSRDMRTVRTRIYTVTTTPDYDADIRMEQSRPRPQLGNENPPNRVWDPVTQQWLPANMVPQRRVYSSGGSMYSPGGGGVTVTSVQPSMPAVRLQPRPGGSPPVITDSDVNAMRQPSETRYLDPYGPEATQAYGSTRREERESAAISERPAPQAAMTKPAPTATKPAAPQTPAEYGSRVPGKPGFVYPPGVEQDTRNMLDVRGLAAGQKVRDPRSGQIFLVP